MHNGQWPIVTLVYGSGDQNLPCTISPRLGKILNVCLYGTIVSECSVLCWRQWAWFNSFPVIQGTFYRFEHLGARKEQLKIPSLISPLGSQGPFHIGINQSLILWKCVQPFSSSPICQDVIDNERVGIVTKKSPDFFIDHWLELNSPW